MRKRKKKVTRDCKNYPSNNVRNWWTVTIVMDNWICSWLMDCYQNTFNHDNNCTKHQCKVYHCTGYYNWTSNDVRPPLVSNVPPPISDHLSKHQNFATRSPSVLITFFLTFCKQPLDSWCVLALFYAVCTTPLRTTISGTWNYMHSRRSLQIACNKFSAKM